MCLNRCASGSRSVIAFFRPTRGQLFGMLKITSLVQELGDRAIRAGEVLNGSGSTLYQGKGRETGLLGTFGREDDHAKFDTAGWICNASDPGVLFTSQFGRKISLRLCKMVTHRAILWAIIRVSEPLHTSSPHALAGAGLNYGVKTHLPGRSMDLHKPPGTRAGPV